MARLSETRLRVDGWSSQFHSVDRWLKHYGQKTQSEHTRRNALDILALFLSYVKETNLDRYVKNSRRKVEVDFQGFLDGMKVRGLSLRHINSCHAYLSTFVEQNGFRKGKKLEVERYHQPSRYRKKS